MTYTDEEALQLTPQREIPRGDSSGESGRAARLLDAETPRFGRRRDVRDIRRTERCCRCGECRSECQRGRAGRRREHAMLGARGAVVVGRAATVIDGERAVDVVVMSRVAGIMMMVTCGRRGAAVDWTPRCRCVVQQRGREAIGADLETERPVG